MNKVHKQKEVKRFIRTNNVSILALLEHKVKEHQVARVLKIFTPGWTKLDNYAGSNKARIQIIWDPQVIECEPLEINEQYIYSELRITSLNCKFSFTAIYGLHTIEARRSLWGKLRLIDSGQQGPWFSMGEYNAIYRAEDMMVGSAVYEVETKNLIYI